MLFHLVDREAWALSAAAVSYAPSSLATEGFIHLSTEVQLLRTAERFYTGREDLVVLSIEEARLAVPVRYEPVHGDSFPHLYGALPREVVVAVTPLRLVNGRFVFP
jgi:uncharacterized protein (DUF952 family)